MNDAFYQTIANASELYRLLQDDCSRHIFWSRLKLDIAPSVTEILRAVHAMGVLDEEEFAESCRWKNSFDELLSSGNHILLYGAGGVGQYLAAGITAEGGEYSGFCDRNYERYPNGLLGKPVYSPTWLYQHKDTCYVVITALGHEAEILMSLRAAGFPQEHILTFFGGVGKRTFPETYFEFPHLFPKGAAFVDGGCFDGKDSLRFIDWCGGDYSKVLAFEPDPANYDRCKTALQRVNRLQLIPAALGEKRSRTAFSASGNMASRLPRGNRENKLLDTRFLNAEDILVDVLPLDELVGNEIIGFIKLDLEGAEMAALRGAKKTLLRDKPLLAISAYHIPGDMLEITGFLHTLIPEYRFWLRHYTFSGDDTILYASAQHP